jgi:hypothetical protein
LSGSLASVARDLHVGRTVAWRMLGPGGIFRDRAAFITTTTTTRRRRIRST